MFPLTSLKGNNRFSMNRVRNVLWLVLKDTFERTVNLSSFKFILLTPTDAGCLLLSSWCKSTSYLLVHWLTCCVWNHFLITIKCTFCSWVRISHTRSALKWHVHMYYLHSVLGALLPVVQLRYSNNTMKLNIKRVKSLLCVSSLSLASVYYTKMYLYIVAK